MKIVWKSIILAVSLLVAPLTCFGESSANLTVLFTGELVGQLTPNRG